MPTTHLQFLCKAEELLASIDAALVACGVPRRAFLLLGSSSAKPREVFEVLLPQPAVPQGPAAAVAAVAGGPPYQQPCAAGQELSPAPQAASRAVRPSRQQRLCQLAVRHLVVGAAELPEGTAHTGGCWGKRDMEVMMVCRTCLSPGFALPSSSFRAQLAHAHLLLRVPCAVPCKLYVLLEGPPVATGGAAADLAADSAGDAAAVQVPPGFTTKRQFHLSMRKGTHVRLLLGQHAEEDEEQQRAADQQQRRAAEEQAPASSKASMGGGSSCSRGEGDGVTVHLSQLPDAASQEQVAEVNQQLSGGGAAYGLPAAAGSARGASDTAGSVWFVARTVLKGLNSGGGSSGVAAGFDGL